MKQEEIEKLQKDLKSARTINNRLRFELQSENQLRYNLQERIKYLEKQLDTVNQILQSVSTMMQLKTKEMVENDKSKKVQ